MSQINRIDNVSSIDTSKELVFKYDGKQYKGYKGDTLASALLANDVHLTGRSFKYHRPRGIQTAGSEESVSLVQLETGNATEPNAKTTMIELYNNLEAKSQNCWPNVKFDINAINEKFSPIFVAGFYYKTFMPSQSLWMQFEKVIRKAAGLGVASSEKDIDRYTHKHHHCDVLVAGGGPSGLVAALEAAKTGARVTVMEETNEFGGWALTAPNSTIDDKKAIDWVSDIVDELSKFENVVLLTRTTVTGYFDHNYLTAVERISDHLGISSTESKLRERFYKIRAKSVVLAQGALERPLLFTNNDRPGVMMASAVRTYINRYSVLPGKNIVLHTNNDSAYYAAIDAHNAGAVVTVVDLRKDVSAKSESAKMAIDAGINVLENSSIIDVKGKHKVSAVEIAAVGDDGVSIVGKSYEIKADVVGMSSGWNPTIHLFSQSGGKVKWNNKTHMYVPGKFEQKLISVGACNGEFNMEKALNKAAADTNALLESVNLKSNSAATEYTACSFKPYVYDHIYVSPNKHGVKGKNGKMFIDFQHDVTVSDIYLADREGYKSVELMKRYTTTGMATDQGKAANVNAISVMASSRGISIPEQGTTTFRPPFTTISFGTLAGDNVGKVFEQRRLTPMNKRHEEVGAVYEPVGDWERARYYPITSKETMHNAVIRECDQVRKSVGMFDASTLGKIDIKGKDSGEFLDRVYTNVFSTLKPGKCRYGLMLNEHGMVWDDGVTSCIAENHYFMTTTTGGAGRVYEMLEEYHQTEWPELDVYITSVTEQTSVCAINGPNARKLLEKLCGSEDVSNEALPFMSHKAMKIAGMPAHVYRISFTGEIAYEIAVPSRYGMKLWDTIKDAGQEFDIVSYGTETMHVLRAEKGYIIVGQDTDGTVTPMDLGMNWIVSKKKKDFIGKRSFIRPDTARVGRKQLVGLKNSKSKVIIPEGAHIVTDPSVIPANMEGHVTSSYFANSSGGSFALALVENGLNRMGEVVDVIDMSGKKYKATITSSVFYDKEGEKVNG